MQSIRIPVWLVCCLRSSPPQSLSSRFFHFPSSADQLGAELVTMAMAAVTHPRTSPPLAYAIISYSFACLGCPLKGKYEWANYVKHWSRKSLQFLRGLFVSCLLDLLGNKHAMLI